MKNIKINLGPAILFSQYLNCGRLGCAADGCINPSLGNNGTQECFELVNGGELNAIIVCAPAVFTTVWHKTLQADSLMAAVELD